MESPQVYLVSACLVGLCTRYDGNFKTNSECLRRLHNGIWIPVCPEQLGGLPTPRPPADIIGGSGADVLTGRARVVTKSGADVSREFIQGAKQVLTIAKSQNITAVFLKSGSPSCAVKNIQGVTASLLEQNGFKLEEF